MRLPRRVPWASIAELDQVCSWIYSDEGDIDAKVLAVHRLSAWRAITTLPHALESTLSLLTVIVQDAARDGPSSHLATRQAYATALIRLVNGLVDPLQLGAYARSIASIAAQLGLPAWLVELRHAATHEDLPSLELLREASQEAMAWLLHNYFIPALNPSAPPKRAVPPLRPLSPLLSQYKNLLKMTTRDASLRSQYKLEIAQVLREIERWVAEAKVAADVSASTLEWDGTETEGTEEDDGRERWALERLCDALLEKGGLVPLSKKKRVVSNDTFQPAKSVLAIWTPLLSHLQALHPSIQSVLISRIISGLLSTPEPTKESVETETISLNQDDRRRDASYDICAAAWAYWLITSTDSRLTAEDDMSKAEEAIVSLIAGLGPTNPSPSADTKVARQLLNVLCEKYPAMQEAAAVLLSAPTSSPVSQWSESDLQTMSERLDKLVDPVRQTAAAPPSVSITPEMHDDPSRASTALPSGWRIIVPLRDGWKPAPIGVHVA